MNIIKKDTFITDMFNNLINNCSTLKIIRRNPENIEQFNEYFINDITNISVFCKREIDIFYEWCVPKFFPSNFLKGINIKSTNNDNILFELPVDHFNNLSFIFEPNKIIIKGYGLYANFEIIREN